MKKMRQVRTPQGTLIATLTLCSDTGESGEAYDVDVQTLPWSRKDSLLTWARPFKIPNSCLDNSESGEAYEAEVEACQGDKPPKEPVATTVHMQG